MKAIPCSLDLRTYGAECKAHTHDGYQLVLALEGQLEMSIAARGGVVSATCGALVTPGTEHSFQAQGDNCFVVADLPLTLSAQLEPLPAWLSLTPTVTQYLRFLAAELRSSSQFADTAADPLHNQMLSLLIELLRRAQGESLKPAMDQRIAIVCEYMAQALGESLTVAQLARRVHLGPRQLAALFRQSMGLSVQAYLLQLRMTLAQQLLCDSELSVQRIAERCGYRNLSAFSDRFRRYTGRSPRYYRSEHRIAAVAIPTAVLPAQSAVPAKTALR